MSRRLDDPDTTTNTRGRLIGWERWCDGHTHELVKGEDYEGRTDTTRVTAQQWARRNGMKAKTTFAADGQSFTFQIVEGLTQERIARAQQLQQLADEGASDDDLRAHYTTHRLPPEKQRTYPEPPPPPPEFDPVAARREKLSDAGSDAGQAVLDRRPPGRGRRLRRS